MNVVYDIFTYFILVFKFISSLKNSQNNTFTTIVNFHKMVCAIGKN